MKTIVRIIKASANHSPLAHLFLYIYAANVALREKNNFKKKRHRPDIKTWLQTVVGIRLLSHLQCVFPIKDIVPRYSASSLLLRTSDVCYGHTQYVVSVLRGPVSQYRMCCGEQLCTGVKARQVVF